MSAGGQGEHGSLNWVRMRIRRKPLPLLSGDLVVPSPFAMLRVVKVETSTLPVWLKPLSPHPAPHFLSPVIPSNEAGAHVKPVADGKCLVCPTSAVSQHGGSLASDTLPSSWPLQVHPLLRSVTSNNNRAPYLLAGSLLARWESHTHSNRHGQQGEGQTRRRVC